MLCGVYLVTWLIFIKMSCMSLMRSVLHKVPKCCSRKPNHKSIMLHHVREEKIGNRCDFVCLCAISVQPSFWILNQMLSGYIVVASSVAFVFDNGLECGSLQFACNFVARERRKLDCCVTMMNTFREWKTKSHYNGIFVHENIWNSIYWVQHFSYSTMNIEHWLKSHDLCANYIFSSYFTRWTFNSTVFISIVFLLRLIFEKK